MQYLASTLSQCMHFWRTRHTHLDIEVFTDASHMIHEDTKGHSGCIILLNGNFVYAKSSKQSMVAESSCEPELYAAHLGAAMVRWVDNFLDDIKIPHPKKITFYQDKMSTMKLMDKGYG